MFLLSKPLIDDSIRVKQWVSFGGDFDNFLLILVLDFIRRRPTSPFTFNYSWLVEEDFVKMVKYQ
jgi:hypothetical protein